MAMAEAGISAVTRRVWPDYNTVWRWHFYAGLFCIPFIFILAITGAIYLFKPQLEASLDRQYEQLAMTGARATAEAQALAAIAAVPGSVLDAYVLPPSPRSAVQVLVKRGGERFRVYVHPETLRILKREAEDGKLMNVVHRLHGTLLIGDRGSNLVELAASWAIVMFITGLYLWWPRNVQNLAGVAYPRLGRKGRVFWRDLHAVSGLWIAFFTLFLLVSGMPWTKSWGGLLKEVRQINAGKVIQQDWTLGGRSPDAPAGVISMAENSEHAGHTMPGHDHTHGLHHVMDYSALDHLVETMQPLHLAAPVLIVPTSRKSPDWTGRSEAQNRPLRVNLVLDGTTGAIKSRKDFAERPLLDRIIGIGVAAHEGQLFGWFNQALGVFTAAGLVLLTASSVVLWWKRRAPATLGAPPASRRMERYALLLMAVIVAIGILLPFLGLSIFLVWLVERWVLPRFPAACSFLGLSRQ